MNPCCLTLIIIWAMFMGATIIVIIGAIIGKRKEKDIKKDTGGFFIPKKS